MFLSAYRISAPWGQVGKAGVKTAPKPSLASWGCACEISYKIKK